MPLLFDRVEIHTTFKPGYDVYIVDDLPDAAKAPPGLVIHLKSKSKCNSRHI